MREREYLIYDVFTDRAGAGNPLAVVLDADGLDAAAMQKIHHDAGGQHSGGHGRHAPVAGRPARHQPLFSRRPARHLFADARAFHGQRDPAVSRSISLRRVGNSEGARGLVFASQLLFMPSPM